MMETYCVKTIKELYLSVKQILTKYTSARVYALYGKMGAGKTAFIKEAAKILGAEEEASSPSFAIINEYFSKKNGTLYHFDFYRIKKMEEAFDLGYEEYFYSGEYCFIEWPEKIEPLLPEKVLKIFIVAENGKRIIRVAK